MNWVRVMSSDFRPFNGSLPKHPSPNTPRSLATLPPTPLHVWWNAAFVWFRLRGADSKKAIQALEQAISSAPDVFSYLLGNPVQPCGSFSFVSVARGTPSRYGGALCRTYYRDHIQHWRQQPGALDFVRNKGADACKRAMHSSSLYPRSGTETYEESTRLRQAAERVNVGVKRCGWCAFMLSICMCTLTCSDVFVFEWMYGRL